MRELVLRIVTRSLLVGLALCVMGYGFAQAYMLFVGMNGGILDETVKWRTPLTMAGFGIIMLIVLEVLKFILRGKRPGVPQSLDETRPVPPKSDASP